MGGYRHSAEEGYREREADTLRNKSVFTWLKKTETISENDGPKRKNLELRRSHQGGRLGGRSLAPKY